MRTGGDGMTKSSARSCRPRRRFVVAARFAVAVAVAAAATFVAAATVGDEPSIEADGNTLRLNPGGSGGTVLIADVDVVAALEDKDARISTLEDQVRQMRQEMKALSAAVSDLTSGTASELTALRAETTRLTAEATQTAGVLQANAKSIVASKACISGLGDALVSMPGGAPVAGCPKPGVATVDCGNPPLINSVKTRGRV